MRFCSQCGFELTPTESNGRVLLRCTSCQYVFWDNPIPVVVAIVEIDGKVVLARNKRWPENAYGLIAGYLEKGETPEACVLREVREELGLQGDIVEFVGNYSFFEKNQLILMFHVQAQGEVIIGDELADVKLVSPERVQPWSAGAGPALRNWLETRGISSQDLRS